MDLSKVAKSAIFAAAAFLVSMATAQASEAVATTGVNVRSGPGVGGTVVVDTLAPGEVVDMVECRTNGWCYVTHPGPDGWVNSRYLTAAPSAGTPDPNCSFRLVIGAGGRPRFQIVCGDGPVPAPAPGPVPATNRVCFYDGANYTGAELCRQVGTYNRLPPAWNDRITSVQLFGNARVQLCEYRNMGSFCRNVTSNVGRLGRFLNGKVSSLRVYTGSLLPVKQACFFDGQNYGGVYFCRKVGRYNSLGVANDRISSLQLFGGAKTRLCVNEGLDMCSGPITSNLTTLPLILHDRVSSLEVLN